LCRTRKPKRACPALDRQICPVCCGTKRMTEISCPATCSYLSASRTHPPAIVQRRTERDMQFLVPLLTELTDAQCDLVLFFQLMVLRHAQGAIPPLLDEDVVAGAAALAATLETAERGIIYEHSAPSLPAQRLTVSLDEALKSLLTGAGSRARAIEKDAMVALRQIARAAGDAARVLSGDEPPVYLRLIARLKPEPAAADAAREGPPGRVII
jgi:hypothetical protein